MDPLTTDILPPEYIPTHWEAYTRGAAKTGKVADRRDWRVCVSMHVAETTEEARRQVLEHGMARTYNEYFFPLFRTLGFFNMIKSDESMPDEALTAEYMMDNRWIVGDPDFCVQRIKELYESSGGFGTLLNLSQDWEPPEIGLNCLDLFANHVAPQLRELIRPPVRADLPRNTGLSPSLASVGRVKLRLPLGQGTGPKVTPRPWPRSGLRAAGCRRGRTG